MVRVSKSVYGIIALQKKAKKADLSFKRPEGMHRELWGLLWTDSK